MLGVSELGMVESQKSRESLKESPRSHLLCRKTKFTYTRLSCWCRRDLRKCTICTCQLIVTVTISGADLLGMHAGKTTYVHNCPHSVALYIMNVEDYKDV